MLKAAVTTASRPSKLLSSRTVLIGSARTRRLPLPALLLLPSPVRLPVLSLRVQSC